MNMDFVKRFCDIKLSSLLVKASLKRGTASSYRNMDIEQDLHTLLLCDTHRKAVLSNGNTKITSKEVASTKSTAESDIYTAAITSVYGSASPYFQVNPPLFDPKAVNFDKIGILYQYENDLYTIYEFLDPATNEQTIQCAWLPLQTFGPFLLAEWRSLPRVQIGRYGVGVEAAGGWWKVHSSIVQMLREFCLTLAKNVDREMVVKEEENMEENEMGKDVSMQSHKDWLGKLFKQAIGAFYGTLKAQKELAAREADKFMGQFMVFED